MPPSSQGRDRRRRPRFNGLPLLANIGGRLVRVMEISAGGMRFILYPCRAGRVDLNRGFGGVCRIVRRDRESVGMRFEPAGYRLVKFVAACTDGTAGEDGAFGR